MHVHVRLGVCFKYSLLIAVFIGSLFIYLVQTSYLDSCVPHRVDENPI